MSEKVCEKCGNKMTYIGMNFVGSHEVWTCLGCSRNRTVVDGSVAQAMEAKIERLTKKLEIAMGALEFYAKRPCNPDLLEIAPRFREPAIEALAQIDKLKER